MPQQTEKQKYPTSIRPEKTAELMAQTGLSEDVLRQLVHEFYGKVRQDDLLGPIFAAGVSDWTAHLEKLTDFWSSVALMTGKYHGQPMQAHMKLKVQARHFSRWLELFRETANTVCTPEGAKLVIARATIIAGAISSNITDVNDDIGLGSTPPNLKGV
ncbi:MAG: group III truncated hemoglobin [Rhodobacteraceae bacterium]|nr:group III truncated hemoglobin [Paracoccaceae bacterium]